MNKKKQIEKHVTALLSLIGDNPERAGIQGTPDRIARMFAEIFRGYDVEQKPRITTFENGKDGIVYDNMIIDEGDFYSMCEHHMMPFFGRYWFAYIPNPNGRILGISKIGRVVDYCAARLQIQERLPVQDRENISNIILENLKLHETNPEQTKEEIKKMKIKK